LRISTVPFHFSSIYLKFLGIKVIPPGMEFKHIAINDADVDGELDIHDDGSAPPNPPVIWSEVLDSICFPQQISQLGAAFLSFQLE
jgi:hypothetical protein